MTKNEKGHQLGPVGQASAKSSGEMCSRETVMVSSQIYSEEGELGWGYLVIGFLMAQIPRNVDCQISITKDLISNAVGLNVS